MYEIGLTGGIGSGKSTVARIFQTLGFEVYFADDRAKAMYAVPEVEEQVRKLFGNQVYTAQGQLDRKALAAIVFKDRNKLAQLNAIIHPATLDDFHRWRDALRGHYKRAFLLKEAAILLEAGSHRGLDALITIYAPQSLRLQRVVSRDESDRAAVLERMANQWSDARKIEAADFVIYNDGVHPIIPQVLAATEYFSNARHLHPKTPQRK